MSLLLPPAPPDVVALAPFRLAPGGRQMLARLPPSTAADSGSPGQTSGVQRRRAEHRLGRACAAELLLELGSPDTTVGVNADRSPCWPRSFTGSITHSRTLVAVALANTAQVRAIGIDAEPVVNMAALDAVEHLCLTPDERQAIGLLPYEARVDAVTAVFSAKEALYKCLYPLVQRFFDFGCAQIDLSRLDEGKIRAQLLQTLSPEFCAGYTIDGSYHRALGHAFTGFCLGWTSGQMYTAGPQPFIRVAGAGATVGSATPVARPG